MRGQTTGRCILIAGSGVAKTTTTTTTETALFSGAHSSEANDGQVLRLQVVAPGAVVRCTCRNRAWLHNVERNESQLATSNTMKKNDHLLLLICTCKRPENAEKDGISDGKRRRRRRLDGAQTDTHRAACGLCRCWLTRGRALKMIQRNGRQTSVAHRAIVYVKGLPHLQGDVKDPQHSDAAARRLDDALAASGHRARRVYPNNLAKWVRDDSRVANARG